MSDAHVKFHSVNGKRRILIVDDELINREILGAVLKQDYDVLLAEDGEEALGIITEQQSLLSLVLLDLLMPKMHGLELLRRLKALPEVNQIPVIVMTSDQSAEVESLRLGAVDFIPKPYPQPEVILARVLRTIEMTEDRDIVRQTERDTLTGLFNREYFYRYALQFDQHHPELAMDAVVLDVNHFHTVNERYGKAYGDRVLKRIAERLREAVADAGGFVCRQDGDTFLVYVPHRTDYQPILEHVAAGAEESDSVNRIRLRMGIYPSVDKEIEIERRFDRANLAANTIRNSFTKNIAFYDNALQESELYAEQLLEDFSTAIAQRQFRVYFQPKYDIRPEVPILASAEALVRWQHPRMGMISPGVFIPLFEENGLIRELDTYVWKETAAQLRDWKERLQFTVPVSVNVSRVDMYDGNPIDTFRQILIDYNLSPQEILLEITESAYTEDSEQIVDTVKKLREIGFRIEMDDFGAGYSSLNMLSILPIDALKLDMQFIRNAFSQGRDTRMLEVMIDIADYLSVPVIAEGVETQEQLHALKAMGCDIVQGYLFSKPLPAQDFEHFLIERKNIELTGPVQQETPVQSETIAIDAAFGKIAHALSGGFETVYYVDTENGHYVAFSLHGKYENLQIQESGTDFFRDSQTNLLRVVYQEDQARVAEALNLEHILKELEKTTHFSLTYRLMIDGIATYYTMKVSRASHDDHHLVFGVINVDDQMQHTLMKHSHSVRSQDFQNTFQDSITYSRIAQALSQDYFAVYYVNTDTEHFVEYSTQGPNHTLVLERVGEDFFEDCKRSIPERVVQEDIPKALSAFDRENLLTTLKDGSTFSISYRLLVEGTPIHASLKALRLVDDENHIVIGVSNIDAQVQRELELEAVKKRNVTFASISQALAQDYFSIYYVDTLTDHFIEYSSHDGYDQLGIEKEGEYFFETSRRNIMRVIHPDDSEKVLSVFTKETLLKEMEQTGTFTLTYRLMFGDTPKYVSMKASRMEDRSDPHIVIGVNNIDAQMSRQKSYEEALAQTLTYSRIAEALSRDYYSIYYVNTKTDEFIEYSSHSDYQDLQVEQSGINFFEDCRRNIMRLVYEPDLDKALSVWEKDRLMPELEDGKTFSVSYRLMFDGKPVFINCKVIRMTDAEDSDHIVIGISNVDAQMKREQEFTAVKEKANRDPLTGVKSKIAYVEAEEELNEHIGAGDSQPFSVVVCDVNGLKAINDTLGHKAGDRYIQDASKVICSIFKHSPVYRIGGDEFVVLLYGQDFENRESLLAELEGLNREHTLHGGVIIASGLSDFNPETDQGYADVFQRADDAMYINKKALKGHRD